MILRPSAGTSTAGPILRTVASAPAVGVVAPGSPVVPPLAGVVGAPVSLPAAAPPGVPAAALPAAAPPAVVGAAALPAAAGLPEPAAGSDFLHAAEERASDRRATARRECFMARILLRARSRGGDVTAP